MADDNRREANERLKKLGAMSLNKTTKALGLQIPDRLLLALADEVIE
jgi:hypothetical protein